jgi:hypothetical protein
MNRRWQRKHPEEMRAFRESWRARNPHYHSDKEARRRARKRAAGAERIDRMAIFERDSGICWLCEEPADPENFHLDHLIPIAAEWPTLRLERAGRAPALQPAEGRQTRAVPDALHRHGGLVTEGVIATSQTPITR